MDEELLFYDDNTLPRRLFVLSRDKDAVLPMHLLNELCRLEVEVVEEIGVSVALLEPSQLSAVVANHFYLAALQSNAFAFAIEDQEEGVCLLNDNNGGEHVGFALTNVVVCLKGTDCYPLNQCNNLNVPSFVGVIAYLSFQPLRYRIRMYDPKEVEDLEVLPHTAHLLPLNTEVRVRGQVSSPQTLRDIANRQRGFATYLPATADQHLAYYDLLYGLKLNMPLVFVEVVEECGVGIVVPSSVLAILCAELRVSSNHKDNISRAIRNIPTKLLNELLIPAPEVRQGRPLPLVKASRILRLTKESPTSLGAQSNQPSAIEGNQSPVSTKFKALTSTITTTANKKRRRKQV